MKFDIGRSGHAVDVAEAAAQIAADIKALAVENMHTQFPPQQYGLAIPASGKVEQIAAAVGVCPHGQLRRQCELCERDERIKVLEEVVQWCVDHSGECIADHPKVLTRMFAALPLPKLPYDGYVVQIVRGDGNPFYWRDGILTDEIARATVYADEEKAEEVASEYAAGIRPGQQIHIGTVSLRKVHDGPSDAELGL